MKVRRIFLMMFAVAMMIAGCKKYDDSDVRSDIDDLKQRVTTLEEATAALKTRLDAGHLVKSVTPLTEAPGGWRIEFTGGNPSVIDILSTESNVSNPNPNTLQIEVRTGAGGSATVWYDSGDGWTDTGVNIAGQAGGQGDQGQQGAPGISPIIRLDERGDNLVVIQYNITEGYPDENWVDAGDPIALDSNPDDLEAIYSIAKNQAAGTITITMNDSDVAEERTVFDFAMASMVARIELVGFNDKVVIAEGRMVEMRFRVNPSNTYVPLTLDSWQLDQTGIRETRASYVTAPTDFELVSIAPDGDLDGQYIATIKCLVNNIGIAEYAMALVLNTGTAEEPALISSPTFVLGAEPQIPLTYTPETWDEVQSIVDRMLDNDTLDISGLSQFPGGEDRIVTKTITITEDITITAQMDPVLGKFGNSTSFNPLHNIHFELAGNPTVTFYQASFNVSTDPKPLISGDGNVIVKDSWFNQTAPIDITGDVTVYGTIAILNGGDRNHTTQIGATQADDNSVPPKPGIKARNVTIYGGAVAGSTATGYVNNAGTSKGGTAIEASGNVTITGEMVEIDGGNYESVAIFGGYGEYGNDGGDAIVVAGKLTVTGAAGIVGGNGTGEGAYGGIGIVASGDVTLSGTRYETATDKWSYSVYVRPGTGEYQPGIPFRFSADGDGRTLTAKTAMISGVDADRSVTPPTGGYAAQYTMELQANDRALLEDCRIGWYSDLPIFSGGYYKITKPFIDTWGTDAKGTPLDGNEWVYVAP